MPVHLSMASASFLSAAPSRPRSLHRGDDAGGGAQRALDILHRAHCGSDQGRDARGNDVTDGVRAARHGAGERRQVLEVRPQRLDGPEIRDHRRAPLRRRRALAAPLTRTSTGFAGQTDFAATVTSQYASHFASTAHPPSSMPPVPVRRSKAPLHAPSHFTGAPELPAQLPPHSPSHAPGQLTPGAVAAQVPWQEPRQLPSACDPVPEPLALQVPLQLPARGSRGKGQNPPRRGASLTEGRHLPNS